jgi:hypothetical protein
MNRLLTCIHDNIEKLDLDSITSMKDARKIFKDIVNE